MPGPNTVLTGVNAFIDGLGGASGTQKMKIVVYDLGLDIVAVSEEVEIPAGTTPHWRHFSVPAVRLSHPSYNFLLYTGGTAGVARIYGDPGSGGEIAASYRSEPITLRYSSTLTWCRTT